MKSCTETGNSVQQLLLLLQGSTQCNFFFRGHAVALPWYHPWYTMGSPRHPIAWHRIPWHAEGGARHAMGGTVANPAATAIVPKGNPTACHGNPHDTPMSMARRFKAMLLLLGRSCVGQYPLL